MFGTIKMTNTDRGFAFIEGEDGRDHFVHMSALSRRDWSNLRIGQAVTFDPAPSAKGSRAENVALV